MTEDQLNRELDTSVVNDSSDHTRVEMPLSDSSGNEVTIAELKELMGIAPDNSIGAMDDLSIIGMGGLGSVFEAQEPVLNRQIAIKILRPAYRNKLNFVSSFIREARITAQIDHPNVIPVHRLGVFDDAGAYFTMKRVVGQSLSHILKELAAGNKDMQHTYTRQRLLEIFVSVCNGVASAHHKGIIHRDLKPSNIMVGDYGEVYIVDWGLAVYRAENDRSQQARKIEIGDLPDDPPDESNTKPKVSGTPAFMAPEQITGDNAKLDEQTDVYALGTILYSILTWTQSPFAGGESATKIMANVVNQKFLRPRRRAPRRRIPFELEAVTLKAMAGRKERRYKSVNELLADVRNYLAKYPVSAYSPSLAYRFFKFIRRHPVVPMTLLAAAMTLGIWNGIEVLKTYVESKSLLKLAQTAVNESYSMSNVAYTNRRLLNDHYQRIGTTETVGKAIDLRSRFLRSREEYELSCNNAWDILIQLVQLEAYSPQLEEMMASLLTRQVNFASTTGNQPMMERIVRRLKTIPEDFRRKVYVHNPAAAQRLIFWDNRLGDLELTVSPEVSAVSAVYQSHTNSQGQRLYSKAESNVKDTGIHKLDLMPERNTLHAGQYMINIAQPGGKEWRFPVVIRQGETEKLDIKLPDRIPPGMIYIPEGNFIFGDRTFDDQPARMNLPGYFIQQYEVTFGEYLEFWKSIKDETVKNDYVAYIDIARKDHQHTALWDKDGKLHPDFSADMPVVGLSVQAMQAYCRYMSDKTGFKYRLPNALEWEKAARGVDGREYVWGGEFNKDLANVNRFFAQDGTVKGGLAPVGSYPQDRSVYGVYDLTGNARELVTSPETIQVYVVKGASFASSPRFARASVNAYALRLLDVGFRCVAELP